MILYKYMSATTAKTVLRGGSIGFTKPDTFNDPFELQAGYPVEASNNPIDQYLNEIRSDAKRHLWSDSSGVLCLTRNPLNALMWAHYGDDHQGVVLGIDTKTAKLNDSNTCLIPAQYGNVIYTHTRPTHPLLPIGQVEPLKVAKTHKYPVGHEESLNRLFLQKPACWSYEEEVRIVKCLSDRDASGSNESGCFVETVLPNKTIFCYQLPKGSIKEIYFGMRHPGAKNCDDVLNEVAEYTALYEGTKILACRLARNTWDIESFDPIAACEEITTRKTVNVSLTHTDQS